MSIESMRNTYSSIMRTWAECGLTAKVMANMAMNSPTTPAGHIRNAANAAPECPHCGGSGCYYANGSSGPCYRCGGKGTLTLSDAYRFLAWASHNHH